MRPLRSLARSVLLTLCILHAGSVAADIEGARYVDPTERYKHGVLGDAIEWGGLELSLSDGRKVKITLPQSSVFEDVAPRLYDLDADGTPEVIVVESLNTAGAQLAVYDETGKIAATPHIGTPNRWLAPIGAADMDSDGQIEVAYIDRPHLAKTLRVWRYSNGALVEVAKLSGLTNHRIGERDIGGGMRTCDSIPEMITANANWTRIIATRLSPQGKLTTRDVGAHTDRQSFEIALAACP